MGRAAGAHQGVPPVSGKWAAHQPRQAAPVIDTNGTVQIFGLHR